MSKVIKASGLVAAGLAAAMGGADVAKAADLNTPGCVPSEKDKKAVAYSPKKNPQAAAAAGYEMAEYVKLTPSARVGLLNEVVAAKCAPKPYAGSMKDRPVEVSQPAAPRNTHVEVRAGYVHTDIGAHKVDGAYAGARIKRGTDRVKGYLGAEVSGLGSDTHTNVRESGLAAPYDTITETSKLDELTTFRLEAGGAVQIAPRLELHGGAHVDWTMSKENGAACYTGTTICSSATTSATAPGVGVHGGLTFSLTDRMGVELSASHTVYADRDGAQSNTQGRLGGVIKLGGRGE